MNIFSRVFLVFFIAFLFVSCAENSTSIVQEQNEPLETSLPEKEPQLVITESPHLMQRTAKVNEFIDFMVARHGFDTFELQKWLDSVDIKDSILQRIAKPSEGLPWYKYRKLFLTETRIDNGVKFWRENQSILKAVEQKTGVPAEILVAIIGVETSYGKNTGNYRVLDALATLGFMYPPRSKFFLNELEQFLLLCREQHLKPDEPLGSYAGAMGFPQFMPSSFRTYAADFDNDGLKDIWKNQPDAIASVAHYFIKNGWQKNEPVAYPVNGTTKNYHRFLGKELKPTHSMSELNKAGLFSNPFISGATKVKLIQFELENSQELWVGLHNFYVITRYNHSPLYAMAVYQLSEQIKSRL